MLGDRSIKELTTAELKEEVSQWFHQIETEIDLPKDYTQHFGKWSEFQRVIEEVLWEYSQVEDTEKEKDELQKKYDALQEAIAEVSNNLMNIEDIEIDYENKIDNSSHVDVELGRIVSRLNNLSDESWEPYKKKAKTKRK